MRTSLRLAAALGLLALPLAPSCGGGDDSPPADPIRVEHLVPGDGVLVQQVDFLYAVAPQADSRWGRVLIDGQAVGQAADMDEGYLNVVLDQGRPLVNVPLQPCALRWIAAYIDLGAEGDVASLDLDITVSSEPVADIRDHTGTPIRWEVGAFTWNAEGIGDLRDPEPGPPPSIHPLDAIDPWEGLTYALCQHPTNVQCANNQCFPMAIANCLQWLEDRGTIVLPHPHVLGLDGDGTVVGQLDELSGRFVTSRAHGMGIWFTPMVDGTFAYLERTELLGLLTHRHQGLGYGLPGPQALPAGGFASHGCSTVEDGTTATLTWVEERFQDGCAVLAVYRYDDVAHAIRVVGVGRTKGRPWILYAHDAQQSHTDPTDTLGLETVFVYPEDLDDDGTLNLATEEQELVFLWAHCP